MSLHSDISSLPIQVLSPSRWNHMRIHSDVRFLSPGPGVLCDEGFVNVSPLATCGMVPRFWKAVSASSEYFQLHYESLSPKLSRAAARVYGETWWRIVDTMQESGLVCQCKLIIWVFKYEN